MRTWTAESGAAALACSGTRQDRIGSHERLLTRRAATGLAFPNGRPGRPRTPAER